jgi:hypothetical protein
LEKIFASDHRPNRDRKLSWFDLIFGEQFATGCPSAAIARNSEPYERKRCAAKALRTIGARRH